MTLPSVPRFTFSRTKARASRVRPEASSLQSFRVSLQSASAARLRRNPRAGSCASRCRPASVSATPAMPPWRPSAAASSPFSSIPLMLWRKSSHFDISGGAAWANQRTGSGCCPPLRSRLASRHGRRPRRTASPPRLGPSATRSPCGRRSLRARSMREGNHALPYQTHVVRTSLCLHLGHSFASAGEGQKRHAHLVSEAKASLLKTSQESHIVFPCSQAPVLVLTPASYHTSSDVSAAVANAEPGVRMVRAARG